MKKLLLFVTILFSIHLYSQCTGGPDPACTGTSGPCGSLHTGTVGVGYQDTLTFYCPNTVDASGPSGGILGIVDFLEFRIVNVSGLPAGMTWNCGDPSCSYDPQPSGRLANINICGTPIVSGTFNLLIETQGTIDGGALGPQTGPQNFNVTLVINNGSGGNFAFSFTPNQGCDSATITFTPLLNFGLPQVTEHVWNFNGTPYTGSTPPPQTFSSPGIYPITCTTNVYQLRLTDLNINVCGLCWWAGDIEELNCSAGNADIIPTFTSGSSNWTGPEVGNDCTPNWSGINFDLTSTSWALSMFENDAISVDDSPSGPVSGIITGTGVVNFNLPSNYSGNFTIGQYLANQIIVTDTVIIYATPSVDTITASATQFCNYETVTLTVDSGFFYEWFRADTILVQSGSNHNYTTGTIGTYKVKKIDPISGCYSWTPPITISNYTPVPPGFATVGISNVSGTLTSILPAGYTYQWLYNNGFGYSLIPAPEGIASSYTPAFNGTYCVVATNSFGCYDTSNCITFYMGIEDVENSFFVTMYPNPTSEQLNLHIENLYSDAVFTLYNMVGQPVISDQITKSDVLLSKIYDVSELGKGIYIAEIKNNKQKYTQRIIVQ